MGDRWQIFILVTLISMYGGVLVAQPLLQLATDAVESLYSKIVDTLSQGPLQRNIPDLLADNRFTENAEYIEAQFSQGLTNEDAKLQFQDLVSKYGYPTQKHEVVTDDGYILSMFRIPGNGSTVFLMHGLLGSADDFVVSGPELGLAFLLAEDGYDVWLGNARGNKHSRRHKSLNPSQPSFWDFSWHEIGYYDLPAMIDYVLDTIGEKSLKYIGHSQGTTSFFVMTSERPEYNDKIALMVALSPVAFMSRLTSPIVRLLSVDSDVTFGIFKLIGVYEFLPDNTFMRTLELLVCGTQSIAQLLCSNIVFLMAGFDYGQLNIVQLPVIYGHIPSGAATKQLIHYAQGVKSAEFRLFDYGSSENMRRYGSRVPPDYKLDNIVANVSLFYSDADWLSNPKDVEVLYSKLPNVIDFYKIPFDPFSHLDFVWAKDFKPLIYDRLRKLLK